MSNIDEITQHFLDTIEEGQYAIKEVGYTEGLADGKKLSSGVSWDNFQDKGNRKDYDRAFMYWDDIEELSPKHKVVPTGQCIYLFYSCSNLRVIDKSKFDLSKADYNEVAYAGMMLCTYCTSLEVFPDIGLQAGDYLATWMGCSELHTIEMLRVNEDISVAPSAFRGCRKLQHILDIEGLFGQNVSFVQCSALTPAAMKNIIKHLKIYKQTELEYEYTITFNSTAFAVLEAEGISEEDWEWLSEQFPNVNIELVKLMVEDSWEKLVGLCLGWNLVA